MATREGPWTPDLKAEFAADVAEYVATNANWEGWSKAQAVMEAVYLLVSDIGAAQQVLDVLGVKVDLWEASSTPVVSADPPPPVGPE